MRTAPSRVFFLCLSKELQAVIYSPLQEYYSIIQSNLSISSCWVIYYNIEYILQCLLQVGRDKLFFSNTDFELNFSTKYLNSEFLKKLKHTGHPPLSFHIFTALTFVKQLHQWKRADGRCKKLTFYGKREQACECVPPHPTFTNTVEEAGVLAVFCRFLGGFTELSMFRPFLSR